MAVPWLRLLVSGLSLQRHEIHPRSVHVSFLVGKEAPWQDFVRLLLFTPVTITPPMLHTSSSTRYSYTKDKSANHANIPKCNVFSEFWDRWTEQYFYCTSCLKWTVQAGICRPLTTQTQVPSWAIPCEICGGKRDVRTGSSPSNQTINCQFRFTSVPYQFVRHRVCRNPATDALNNSGDAVSWYNALQAERSRVLFPTRLSEFFIDLILLVALWPWGGLSL